jgi:ubiquinone/menaquinone biosynthesis C-methylase UbiE
LYNTNNISKIKKGKLQMGSTEYFNQIAGKWDEVRTTLFSENVRKVAVKYAEVKRGLVAADIGAGAGFITEELLRNGLNVIAVDQSLEMVNEMKKRFSNSKDAEFRLGESESLPLNNESVDLVFANMYLHHVETPAKAIKEMVRILKPGGKLIITDADEHNYEFLRTEQHDVWLGFKREDIRSWFSDAGLADIKVDCVGENCCPTSESSGEKVEISIFVAMGKKPMADIGNIE